MNPPAPDVHRVLAYSEEKATKRFLAIAALPLVVGFAGTFVAGDDNRMMTFSVVLMVGGLVFGLFVHFRLFNPGKPLLVLSPKGLLLRTAGPDIFIPWTEVRGVDAITFRTQPASTSPLPMTFENVTAVTIPESFYNALADSYSLMNGRAWKHTFIPKGRWVQVALHHDILPVAPDELRRQVAARWHAFRGSGRPGDSGPDAPEPVAPAAMSPAQSAAESRSAGDGNKEKDIKFVVRWDK